MALEGGAKVEGLVAGGERTLLLFLFFFFGRLDEDTTACCSGTPKANDPEETGGKAACPTAIAEPPACGGPAERPNPAKRC